MEQVHTGEPKELVLVLELEMQVITPLGQESHHMGTHLPTSVLEFRLVIHFRIVGTLLTGITLQDKEVFLIIEVILWVAGVTHQLIGRIILAA